MHFYTLGYSGWAFERLIQWALDRDGLLVDIRFNPWSRVEQWRKQAFEAALAGRYTHVPALGNRRYRDHGAIELADPAAGIAHVERLAEAGRIPMLMCACANAERCHRRVVAELLANRGHTVTEIPPDYNQLPLF